MIRLPPLRLPPLFVALTLCGACPAPIEAPAELEPLASFFWRSHRDGDDVALREGAKNLEPLVLDLTADGPQYGGLPDLADEDLAWVELEGVNDPDEAPGFFQVSRLDCDMDTLRAVTAYPDQSVIHDGVYDSYERDFHGDADAFTDGDSNSLEFTTTYSATPTADQYTAVVENYVRAVEEGPDADGETRGAILTQATWLPSPASFEVDSSEFTQDYQSSVFLMTDSGETLHLVSIWRWMKLGIVDVNDDAYLNFFLPGLIEWDEETQAACDSWPNLDGG